MAGPDERFRSRAKRRIHFQKWLWPEALGQVAMGWLDPPMRLAPSGRLADWPNRQLNLTRRFPAQLGPEIRACGDMRRPQKNMG